MYIGKVLNDRPLGFWSLDEAPFHDLSGNAKTPIASGIESGHGSLVSGGGHSSRVGSGSSFVFDFPLIKPGYENRPWTWEFWFHPLNVSQSVDLLLAEDAGIGVTFNGADLNFVMPGVTTLNYEVKSKEAYHVVITHNIGRNSLYINGELVDATNLPAQGFAYTASEEHLTSSGPHNFLLDSVAVYARELPAGVIRRHFNIGRDVELIENVVMKYGGYYFEPSDSNADIYIYRAWDSVDDFSSSPLYDVNVGAELSPKLNESYEPTISAWIMPINLGARDNTTVAGIKLSWVGTGDFTVEYTMDNITWVSVQNNEYKDLANLNIVDKIMDVRVTFDDSPASLEFLDLTVYKSANFNSNIRNISFTGKPLLTKDFNQPLEGNLARGAGFAGGGALIASADVTENPQNTKVVETWASFNTEAAFTVFDQRTTGATARPYVRWSGSTLETQGVNAVYIDGQPVTTWTPTAGPHLITAVLSTANNFATRFGASYDSIGTNGYVQSVAFYPNTITDTQALRMYNTYFGITTNQIIDSTTIKLKELPEPYEIIAYNWSIVASG